MDKYSIYKAYYKNVIYNQLYYVNGMHKEAGLMQLLNKANFRAAGLMPILDHAPLPTGPMSMVASYTRDPRIINAYHKITGKPYMANLNNTTIAGNYNDVYTKALSQVNTANPIFKKGYDMFKNNKHTARELVKPNTSMSPKYNSITGAINNVTRTMESSGFGVDDIIGTLR